MERELLIKKPKFYFCRWHRVAWSIYNENVRLYVDCRKVADLSLPRDMNRRLRLQGGAVVFGRQMNEDVEVFEVCIDYFTVFVLKPSSASEVKDKASVKVIIYLFT